MFNGVAGFTRIVSNVVELKQKAARSRGLASILLESAFCLSSKEELGVRRQKSAVGL